MLVEHFFKSASSSLLLLFAKTAASKDKTGNSPYFSLTNSTKRTKPEARSYILFLCAIQICCCQGTDESASLLTVTCSFISMSISAAFDSEPAPHAPSCCCKYSPVDLLWWWIKNTFSHLSIVWESMVVVWCHNYSAMLASFVHLMLALACFAVRWTPTKVQVMTWCA